jgi:hypothetical protein
MTAFAELDAQNQSPQGRLATALPDFRGARYGSFMARIPVKKPLSSISDANLEHGAMGALKGQCS